MAKEESQPRFFRADELFRPKTPVDIAASVKREMAEERKKTIIDPSILREQRAWNVLRDKVVGAEGT